MMRAEPVISFICPATDTCWLEIEKIKILVGDFSPLYPLSVSVCVNRRVTIYIVDISLLKW